MNTCLTYTELKTRYNVDSRQLRRLISPFIDELQNAGYKSGQRIFTPKQVKIIVNNLE